MPVRSSPFFALRFNSRAEPRASTFRSHARTCRALLVLLSIAASSCVQAAQSYPLRSRLAEGSVTGSLSVERVEGGQRLVVVQLSALPPPERIGPGLKEFVVWLSSPSGKAERAGALAYDRAHQSGSLFATTNLATFTLQVTGERDPGASAPSDVLLAERKVSTNWIDAGKCPELLRRDFCAHLPRLASTPEPGLC